MGGTFASPFTSPSEFVRICRAHQIGRTKKGTEREMRTYIVHIYMPSITEIVSYIETVESNERIEIADRQLDIAPHLVSRNPADSSKIIQRPGRFASLNECPRKRKDGRHEIDVNRSITPPLPPRQMCYLSSRKPSKRGPQQVPQVPYTIAGTDREVLLALYQSTGGDNWADGWKKARRSNLYGVELNNNGRVVKLCLGLNNLRGIALQT